MRKTEFRCGTTTKLSFILAEMTPPTAFVSGLVTASRGSPLGSCWFENGFEARHCALLPAMLKAVACSQQAADFSLLHCFLELGFQWSLCRLVSHPSCGEKGQTEAVLSDPVSASQGQALATEGCFLRCPGQAAWSLKSLEIRTGMGVREEDEMKLGLI